jgi:hypothetical protein
LEWLLHFENQNVIGYHWKGSVIWIGMHRLDSPKNHLKKNVPMFVVCRSNKFPLKLCNILLQKSVLQIIKSFKEKSIDVP